MTGLSILACMVAVFVFLKPRLTMCEHLGSRLYWLYCGRNPEANMDTLSPDMKLAASRGFVASRGVVA